MTRRVYTNGYDYEASGVQHSTENWDSGEISELGWFIWGMGYTGTTLQANWTMVPLGGRKVRDMGFVLRVFDTGRFWDDGQVPIGFIGIADCHPAPVINL